MPPMESFPKSHIVTFKYYVGIILFLEEDYVQVLLIFWYGDHRLADNSILPKRQKSILQTLGTCAIKAHSGIEST